LRTDCRWLVEFSSLRQFLRCTQYRNQTIPAFLANKKMYLQRLNFQIGKSPHDVGFDCLRGDVHPKQPAFPGEDTTHQLPPIVAQGGAEDFVAGIDRSPFSRWRTKGEHDIL
jgi:hypothetical protein